MSILACCVQGFEWDGTPTGRVGKLANNPAYISGDNKDAAVLIVSDILGWTLPNTRLLADHYAREANVTVYVPDFFAGEVLPMEPINKGRFHEVDLGGFLTRNSRENREPEIIECARALRAQYKKVAAAGFCYGGWACLRLGAKEHQPALVDCIVIGQPSHVVEKDIDEVAVPVQILAPETDMLYTDDLKLHTFVTLQKTGVPFDYHHFPGVEHGCLVRGDETKEGEREAMVRGKTAAIGWIKQYLFAD
ncbi:uncharacterized protein JN550_002491 [Neoarthrinium moseri]|uniref:uncharacterized protein n=1 Tax=Neoarthrinium moseri TaxID=1658444 RepID=UPI001FDB02A4|nr:uncharacterized protein JN550_002491 [Neoarthrinium moseri]KAI1875062.1 hypothetical protein JN550_002491 [Neoarthrinium moseri]